MKENPWARLLAYVTSLINQELLLKNESLGAGTAILYAAQPGQLPFEYKPLNIGLFPANPVRRAPLH